MLPRAAPLRSSRGQRRAPALGRPAPGVPWQRPRGCPGPAASGLSGDGRGVRLEPAGFGTPRGAGATGSPRGSRIGPSTVTSGLAGALLHGGALDVPALPGLVYFPPPRAPSEMPGPGRKDPAIPVAIF